jgi:predicted LPLAT superfamily acyltransferase
VSEPAQGSRQREEWQERPEAGGRVGGWLLRSLPFRVGRPVARLITYPVALYFMWRRAPERAASREYLAKALGRPPTSIDVYRHFLCFAQVTLDRLYLMAESFKRFEVSTVGLDQLDAALSAKRGTLLLSAHLGSFDALRVLSERRPEIPIRILLDMGQNAGLTDLLNALNPELAVTIIDARRPGPELVLAMQEALACNAIVSTLADRLRPGNPSVTVRFFGAPAAFPTSPWLLAGVLRVPIVLAFGLYRGGRKYELHFEVCEFDMPRDRHARPAALTAIVQKFADKLAYCAKLAPYNWFNLYDFWKIPSSSSHLPDDAASDERPGA